MHKRSKSNHGHDIGHEDSQTYDHGKLFEEQKVAEKQNCPTNERGNASRCDAQPHLSVALFHFVEPGSG